MIRHHLSPSEERQRCRAIASFSHVDRCPPRPYRYVYTLSSFRPPYLLVDRTTNGKKRWKIKMFKKINRIITSLYPLFFESLKKNII